MAWFGYICHITNREGHVSLPLLPANMLASIGERGGGGKRVGKDLLKARSDLSDDGWLCTNVIV